MNQQDALLYITYFNNKPLQVSNRLAAHHQEDQLCINSIWCSLTLCLAAGRNGMELVFSLVDYGVLIGFQVGYDLFRKLWISWYMKWALS